MKPVLVTSDVEKVTMIAKPVHLMCRGKRRARATVAQPVEIRERQEEARDAGRRNNDQCQSARSHDLTRIGRHNDGKKGVIRTPISCLYRGECLKRRHSNQ
jgi:hypothetical protein